MCETTTCETAEGTIGASFDGSFPCIICELPVRATAVGGTAVCPWCDLGIYRDGSRWTSMRRDAILKEAQEKARTLGETYEGSDTYKE